MHQCHKSCCEDIGLSEIVCPCVAQNPMVNHAFPYSMAIIGGIPYFQTHPILVKRPKQTQTARFQCESISSKLLGGPILSFIRFYLPPANCFTMFDALGSTIIVTSLNPCMFWGPITTMPQHSCSQLQPQAWSRVSGILPQVLVLLRTGTRVPYPADVCCSYEPMDAIEHDKKFWWSPLLPEKKNVKPYNAPI